MATSYAERRAAGVCTQCGKTEAVPGKSRCQPCADRQNAQARAALADPERAAANRARVREWQARYPMAHLEKNQRYRARLWAAALDAYGHACACCGESEEAFLTIDHVGGGGRRHREETGARGSDFYRLLQQQGYPEGYRTLCWNCNCALGIRGYCPHELARQALG